MQRRRRALAALLLLAGSPSCAPLERNTRTERGPLLRTFHRPQILEGGVSASASLAWPTLSLELLGHDTCRDLELEEYAEEKITEKSSPSTGPSLSMGIALTLASAVLYGISPLLSNSPDTSTIDASGNYGPSTGTVVRGWSIVSLAVGLPALGVGLVSLLRTGTEVERLKTEQVINQHDQGCNERKLSGPVELSGANGPVLTGAAVDGLFEVKVSAVPERFEAVTFAARAVTMDDESRALVEAFAACVELERLSAAPLLEQSADELAARARALHGCRPARGDELTPLLRAVEAELASRQSGELAEPPRPGPAQAAVGSFEEALTKYAPRLRLRAGSRDLDALEDLEAVRGQSALLEGMVRERTPSNLAVVQVGARVVYVALPPRPAAAADLREGMRVEAVVLLAGTQTTGEVTLPLARAIWVRTAF